MKHTTNIKKFVEKLGIISHSQNAITIEIRESKKQTAYFNAIVPSNQYEGISNNSLTEYIFQAISSLKVIDGLVMTSHPNNNQMIRCFANNHNKKQFYDFISEVKIEGINLNPVMK